MRLICPSQITHTVTNMLYYDLKRELIMKPNMISNYLRSCDVNAMIVEIGLSNFDRKLIGSSDRLVDCFFLAKEVCFHCLSSSYSFLRLRAVPMLKCWGQHPLVIDFHIFCSILNGIFYRSVK